MCIWAKGYFSLLLLAVKSVINCWAPAVSNKRFLFDEERDTSNTTQHSVPYCNRRGPNTLLNPMFRFQEREDFVLFCAPQTNPSWASVSSLWFSLLFSRDFPSYSSVTIHCFWTEYLPSGPCGGFEWFLLELQAQTSVRIWEIFLQDLPTVVHH